MDQSIPFRSSPLKWTGPQTGLLLSGPDHTLDHLYSKCPGRLKNQVVILDLLTGRQSILARLFLLTPCLKRLFRIFSNLLSKVNCTVDIMDTGILNGYLVQTKVVQSTVRSSSKFVHCDGLPCFWPYQETLECWLCVVQSRQKWSSPLSGPDKSGPACSLVKLRIGHCD